MCILLLTRKNNPEKGNIMKNLKMSKKLLVGFGSVLVLLIVIVYFSASAFKTVGALLTEFYEEPYTDVQIADEFMLDVNLTAKNMLFASSSTDDAETAERLDMAGIEVIEARINYLAYAPEIAAVMLRRQQADAIISAREKIVEGAVSMVKMAIDQLADNNVVELDEERKAAMVSNLLVVLCSDESAQPVVNAGTLHH